MGVLLHSPPPFPKDPQAGLGWGFRVGGAALSLSLRPRLEVVHPPPAHRCLGSEGHSAVLVALLEKQQQVLSDLEQEQVRLLDPGSGQVGVTVVIIRSSCTLAGEFLSPHHLQGCSGF